MLHAGDDNFVAGLEVLAAVAAGNQVQPLGSAPDVNNLLGSRRVDEPSHRLAARLVVVGGALAQRVDAAMHVGVVVQVVVGDGVNHRPGLLRRRRVVQIYQRFPVHLLVQDWEILAQPARVKGRQSVSHRGVAPIRCVESGRHERPPTGSAISASGIAFWNRASRYSRSGSSATVSIISLANA